MARVRVRCEWPAGLAGLPERARARVTVEDVTLQDAASTILAQRVVEDLDLASPPEVDLDVEEYDESADLVVRVHVTPGERQTRDIEVADLITTQSHPVLTHGYGDSVVVPLRVVGG